MVSPTKQLGLLQARVETESTLVKASVVDEVYSATAITSFVMEFSHKVDQNQRSKEWPSSP